MEDGRAVGAAPDDAGLRMCQRLCSGARARWKRLALLIFLALTVLTYLHNSALLDGVRLFTPSAPEPTINFTQFDYPSSLEFLRIYKEAWKQYGENKFEKSSEQCPEVSIPEGIENTRVKVKTESLSFEDLRHLHSEVKPGGHWYPENCTARYRSAIIIPYRNREAHLRSFLHNVHPFLQTQKLDYAIFVVEQRSGSMFNRGMLMNIGFAEARKVYDWQCYVFHDVDLIPEDIRNFYTCPGGPRHLSAAVDKFDYKLLYATLFGGATILKKSDVLSMNGYSNQFWGWGGEDDDFYERTRYAKLKFVRYPMDIARYKMLSHKPDKENPVNPKRYTLIRTGKRRYKTDGVNSLKYDLIRFEPKRLFTWVYVRIDGPS